MRYYLKYFHKEIERLSFICLVLSILVVALNELIHHREYTTVVNQLEVLLLVTAIVLMVLGVAKKLTIQHAFLIFIYLFTFNIYYPGFLSEESFRLEIISTFSNLGGCIIYLILAGIIGGGFHVVLLGGMNVLLIVSVVWASRYFEDYALPFDPVVILMFAAVTGVVYGSFWLIEKSLLKFDQNQKQVKQVATELLTLKIEEGQKRNSFLSMILKDDEVFVNNLITQIALTTKEKDEQEKAKQLLDLKRLCQEQNYKTTKSESAQWYKETDTDFIARLKIVCPQLTQKEQHICSLIRFGLQTKEIADKLNTSIETIKWYRKKIRKKMNIGGGENLNLYMNGL